MTMGGGDGTRWQAGLRQMMVEMTPMTMKMNQTCRRMLPMVNPPSSSSSLSHEYERVQQKELFFGYPSHPHSS